MRPVLVVFLVPSLLLGCQTVYERFGAAEGDSLRQIVREHGLGMAERWHNPKIRIQVKPDYTGWLWWPSGPSTAVGLRFEHGIVVERDYGWNHWRQWEIEGTYLRMR